MRSKDTIEFLGLWEQLNNPNFKPVEFDGFKNKLDIIPLLCLRKNGSKYNTRLATLPRQAEWEAHMSKYQVSKPGQASHQKWQLMQHIFGLNE